MLSAWLHLQPMKAGFVNIFGKPNAGKSTLLNAMLKEKLAIVTQKAQTTRHRIKGIVTEPGRYQIIFSDTPGIIDPKYKLHEKMMQAVKSALEDADIALLVVDSSENPEEADAIFQKLKLSSPGIVVLNKSDQVSKQKLEDLTGYFSGKPYSRQVLPVSALKLTNLDLLLNTLIEQLPEGESFYNEDDISDLPTKFFVGEMVREKIFFLMADEIPYHSAILVNEFKEKDSLIKIQADIIVQRESQKAIVIGEGGKTIKQIGSMARIDIEQFLGRKIFLQLFVKVRPKWRDNEQQLKEYGYR